MSKRRNGRRKAFEGHVAIGVCMTQTWALWWACLFELDVFSARFDGKVSEK